jgi:hypothetical protein
MRFATVHHAGFGMSRITPEEDGSAMVFLGSSLDKEDRLASWENVELSVRVQNARSMTFEEIQQAALTRAAMMLAAATDTVKVQSTAV